MPNGSTNIFVSYSHYDASLVDPVVKLLRVNNSYVFQDIDYIRPGKKWRSEISKALTDAQLVVVFWCNHASKSMEVSNEWKQAIEQEKDLLPLLLDETPLPPQLSEFQWIDFRDTVGLAHCAAESPAAKPLILAKGSRFPLVLFATASIAIMSLSSLWLFYTLNNSSQKTLNNFFQKRFSPIQDSSQVGPLLELPPIVNSAYDNSRFLVVSVLLAIVLCLILLVRWRARRRSINEKAGFSMKEIERKIAKELETEIFRRTKGRLHVEA